MVILLHSSKTTRRNPKALPRSTHRPQLIDKARQLAIYLQTLPLSKLQKHMHVSPSIADKTAAQLKQWTTDSSQQVAAIDLFVGDIYSGLRSDEWAALDREYAHKTLRILSGLYGVLRALDGIMPYRVEMGYRFPDQPYDNLYSFWGKDIAQTLPDSGVVVNTSSDEYTKAVLPYIDPARIITPHFLTLEQHSEPTFVTVHTKIARGAFAGWLIRSRITDPAQFKNFSDLGYLYDATRSTPAQPTYVCKTFGGKGLSRRLS